MFWGKKYESYEFGAKRKLSFFQCIVNLIGHLVGSAVLFLSLYLLAWVISFIGSWLNGIHPLHEQSTAFFAKVEHWILIADSFLCVILIVVGAVRFIVELGDTL